MSNLKRFFKDTVIYGIASVLPRAITILLTKLKTSTFESDIYSEDTNYYIYAAYFNVLLTFGLETAFFRFFTKEQEKGKVVSTSFISMLTLVLGFLFITLFFATPISNFLNFSNPLFFKLLIYTLVLDTIVVIPYAYLRVTKRPIKFAFFKISNVFIYAVLNVFFLWIVPKFNITLPLFITQIFGNAPQIIYIFFAGVVASLFTLIAMLPIVFKFKFAFDKIIFKKLFWYGLPIMIAGLAYITNENLDKLLLKRFSGETTMGIYSACYKLGLFMTLFITAFRLGAEPFFFNQAAKKNAKQTYAEILNWFTIFGAFILLVVVLFLPLFANILLGKPSYFEALKIVPIILLANLFLGIYHNLSIWYKLTDKTRFGMYFSIIGAIITIVLNLMFIQKYGYMAAAWITLFVYFIMTLLSYFYGKKYYAIPYNLKKVGFYIVLASLLAAISYLKFESNYIVSVLILILFIGIVYQKEKTSLQKIRASK